MNLLSFDVICATMYLMKPRELVMAATSEVTFDLGLEWWYHIFWRIRSKSHNFFFLILSKYKSMFSFHWAQKCPAKFPFGIKGKYDFQ